MDNFWVKLRSVGVDFCIGDMPEEMKKPFEESLKEMEKRRLAKKSKKFEDE